MDGEPTIWDRVNAISTALLVVTALIALVFAHSQIQESRDEARIVHLQEMSRQFSELPISARLKSLALKRIDQKQNSLRPLNPEDAPDEMYDLMNFFETIGLLADRGYLDKRDVWNEFGWWLFNFYADARPVVESEQKDDPAMYVKFSRLMGDLEQIEKEESAGKLNHPSPDDLYRFYRAEITTPPAELVQRKGRRKAK